ncbi:hypothetical protein [Marilutibacter maris]|uniref:hypothetical protein n=1 Tax=Marilutibacter maris TaxID=1605891 RepID=UPI0011AE76E1|nr:hypothetical protein [Lysobacter maris]
MHARPVLPPLAVLAVLVAVAVAPAMAGEVSGPPGSDNPRTTGAPANANSNCAYSGLNDFDPDEGQNESIVQTAADAWKYYGLPHGFPGLSGACRGGSNEAREKGTGGP